MNLTVLSVLAEVSPEWETPGDLFVKLLILLGLVLLNGFFVAAEFAIVKVRASQLEEALENGEGGATFASHVAKNPELFLGATQLGITVSSLALGWFGGPYIATAMQPVFFMVGVSNETVIIGVSIFLAFLLLTFLHVVLGELAPKSLAIRRPVPTMLWTARPLGFIHTLFKPLIALLNISAGKIIQHVLRINPVEEIDLVSNEEELRMILAETEVSEEVSPLGKEILINALDMRRRVVRDIMLPRGKVVFLDVENDFETNLKVARESRHTRFPLCRAHLDNTLGLVHIKDLLAQVGDGNHDLTAIRRDLLPVPELMPLEKLLTFFLARHAHLALVVDEYGGTVGIVTLDNVLEELVGEIQDEFDTPVPEFSRVSEQEFHVTGMLGLYELGDLADLHLESTEVSTVGGYVTHLLGHLPKEGETVQIEDYEVTVLKTDGRSVGQLKFFRVKMPAEEEE